MRVGTSSFSSPAVAAGCSCGMNFSTLKRCVPMISPRLSVNVDKRFEEISGTSARSFYAQNIVDNHLYGDVVPRADLLEVLLFHIGA